MRRRRLILAVVLLLLVVVVGLLIIGGIPLIQALFTEPITGLPPTPATNSLRARFTQTASAKKTTVPVASGTPSAEAK